MADIDTSSYPKAKSTNPLEQVSGFANLQNTLNQNKLFQQQFQTNKAVSDIYKRAVKPDGTLDMDQIRDELSKNPDAAYGLQEAFKGAQGLQQGQIATDVAKLDQVRKHLEAASGYFTPLLKPGSSSTDVATALSHAMTNGLLNTEMASKVWSTLPRDQKGQIDEGQIPAWAQQQQLQVMSQQERLNAMHPAPTQVDTGAGINLMRLPQIGEPSLAGTVEKGLPPTTQRYNPVTKQMEFIGQGGGGGGQAAQGGGGIAAAPPLGAPEAAASAATFAAGQGNSLQARADQVPTTKSILGNLEAELNSPGFSTGPGTKSMADLTKFLNTQLGTNIRTEGLAGREQFNKLAGMLAQSQFQALGGTGTDAKLDATTLTSPSSELTKMGNRGIIAMLKGNEDAIAAKNKAWQAWQQQNGPQSYGQFSTQFNQSYDPRVFQSQYLGDADKKKMVSGLTQPEKNKLFQAFTVAKQNGWIQ